MKLTDKLVEVSKAITYLEKDKTNKMQGYKYLSEAKVKSIIKSLFETNRIVFNYSTEEVREYEISSTSKGTKQFCTIASGKYSFIDCDSDMVITGTWFGSGTDTGDKGLYKAITGGIKYVINTNFLIPTGDDPENDDNSNGSSNVKNDDIALKKELLAKHKGDKIAAKKEYEELKKEHEPGQEKLSPETERYIEEKFNIKESA